MSSNASQISSSRKRSHSKNKEEVKPKLKLRFKITKYEVKPNLFIDRPFERIFPNNESSFIPIYNPIYDESEKIWRNIPKPGSILREPYTFESGLIHFKREFEDTGLYRWEQRFKNNTIALFINTHGGVESNGEHYFKPVTMNANVNYLKKITLSDFGKHSMSFDFCDATTYTSDKLTQFLTELKLYIYSKKIFNKMNLIDIKRIFKKLHIPNVNLSQSVSSSKPPKSIRNKLRLKLNAKKLTKKRIRKNYKQFIQSLNENNPIDNDSYEYNTKKPNNKILFNKKYYFDNKDIEDRPYSNGVHILFDNGVLTGYDKIPEPFLNTETYSLGYTKTSDSSIKEINIEESLRDYYYGSIRMEDDYQLNDGQSISFSTQDLINQLTMMGYSQILIIDNSCSSVSKNPMNENYKDFLKLIKRNIHQFGVRLFV